MLFFALIIIAVLVIVLIVTLRKNKQDRNRYESERQMISDQFESDIQQTMNQIAIEHLRYEHERQQFDEYKGDIEAEKEQQRETQRRRYVTKDLKDKVFLRDNATCQICGISKQYMDSLVQGLGDYLLLEVDHVVSVKNGGSGNDMSNLQVLCWRCNRKKSGTKTNDFVRQSIDYGISKLLPMSHDNSDDLKG